MPRAQPRLRLIEGQGQTLDPPVSIDSAFRRWAPYVGGIVQRLLGPGADVDDLVQDVFVDAVRGIDNLRDPDAMRAWLTTIAVRRVRRRLGRQRLRHLFRFETAEVPDPALSPEKKLALRDAYRVLDRVKPAERIAWILRHVEGEGLVDVARICGCSRATAHRRIAAVEAAFAKEFRDER
ncbi:MAG: sigma-70 family RNA polymerase sigma factor [Myxococcota bacterium]